MNIVMVDTDYNFSLSLSQFLKGSGNIDTVGIFEKTSEAVSFFRSTNKKMEFVLFDLSVPDLVLDSFVHSVPSNATFIALTNDTDTLYKYNNYPFFQRLFLKPLSFSSFLNYLLFQNEDFLNSARTFMLDALSNLGFNINHSGTIYLIEASIFVIRNKITKLSEVYSALACSANTDPKIIGWSINNAIHHAIKCDNGYRMQSFFKLCDKQKISAKYIINYFANFIPTKLGTH